MWWPIPEILIYITIGLVTFKVIYFFNRSKDLTKFEEAKIELRKAKAQLNKHPYKESHVSDGSYDLWRSAESRLSEAQRKHRAVQEQVDGNVALSMSSAIAALWPISLVVITAVGLWKLFKLVFFAGGMDRAARKRATKLTAGKWEQFEKEQEQARLLELAKEEGLIPVKED